MIIHNNNHRIHNDNNSNNNTSSCWQVNSTEGRPGVRILKPLPEDERPRGSKVLETQRRLTLHTTVETSSAILPKESKALHLNKCFLCLDNTHQMIGHGAPDSQALDVFFVAK